jgi:gamma-glutamyltranspeptidase/glutathione hydrolase
MRITTQFGVVRAWIIFAAIVATTSGVPVTVTPVTAEHGIVVAGHPEAAEAGITILKSGGNAIDAAIATSLTLGVAEPYGSGVGGKLVLLYYEAATGKTTLVDAVDAVGSLDVAAYLKRPEADHSYGYGAVCVPGLIDGLWRAHEKWGTKKWAEDVQPAVTLARTGFSVLPKTVEFFEEQEKKLRRGDAEIARLYLPDGKLPVAGTRLANPDLARTLESIAAKGRDGFYRGDVAEKIAAASRRGGGALTLEDLANYEARFGEPLGMDFRGFHLACANPARGAPLFLTIMKVLEEENFGGGPLRSAANLDHIGRVWRVIFPRVERDVIEATDVAAGFARLISPESVKAMRLQVAQESAVLPKAAEWKTRTEDSAYALAATTHFIVVDARGNIVCATQSLSVHFGAGVVPPGTGVVLNNSMGTFAYANPASVNFIAPGRRPRTAISPTLVFRDGKPVLAVGVPGAVRIPTAMLQLLLDRLALKRPLADAIGDTRFHFDSPWRPGETEAFEAEASLPENDAAALRASGWKVILSEPVGRGRYFGGINAVQIHADGFLTGFPDPRRTNAAIGW